MFSHPMGSSSSSSNSPPSPVTPVASTSIITRSASTSTAPPSASTFTSFAPAASSTSFTLSHTPTYDMNRLPVSGSHTMDWSQLPAELLVEVFGWLPPSYHSGDRLAVCSVCRSWSRPAQAVLWRSVWLGSCEAVSLLADVLVAKPELGNLPRALRFSTLDDMYLAELDADAVFMMMNTLENLEQFDVFVTYAAGDLYDSLCEELKGSPIKKVMLGANEGMGRCHVQASMRFQGLEYLELIRLGPLGDLESLELEWIYPESLVELVLIQPEMSGDDLKFLLAHTKGTVKRLRIDFGHLVPGSEEDGTPLSQADVEGALLESGANLRRLEIRWAYCTANFLNEAIQGLFGLEELVTTGSTCDPGRIDQQCQANLTRMCFDIKTGSSPPESLIRLAEPESRRSNLIKYHMSSAFEDPGWDATVPTLKLNDGLEPDVEREEWPEASIIEWKKLSARLKVVGITFTTDFF